MIAGILSIKKCNLIVTELFIRGRKLKIPLAFVTKSHFVVPENIRLNSTHYSYYKNSKQTRTYEYKRFYESI